MKKKPLIILTGPTAVGKTETSIAFAKATGGEIISADSIQVYRHMDIGSAKITKEEMEGVPHYLIDEWEPDEDFNVVIFQKKALEYMNSIYSHDRIPIITGGTGFYIQSVLYGIEFDHHDTDTSYRDELENLANKYGNLYLFHMLKELDPKSAEIIHYNNRKRVIRALEYYQQTGCRISEHNEIQHQKESPYQFIYFVLTRERETLYQRINMRVDLMFEKGLVKEVESLADMGYGRDLVSMQGLGYKEVYAYLCGERTLEETKDLIKQETRHFAKRQLTWFRREKDVTFLEIERYKNVGELVEDMLRMWNQKQHRQIFCERRKGCSSMIDQNLKQGYESLRISDHVLQYGEDILRTLTDRFTKIDQTAEYNQMKVLATMQKNKVSDVHFAASTGYGYNDIGRDTLESVYADIFHTEAALVRPQLTCGTHALAVALSSNLHPGDELLSPVGKPYDTLEGVIGIRKSVGSLKEYGISYAQVDLLPDGGFDYKGIEQAINEKTKLVTIQRSKGYQTRPTLSVKRIGELIAFIKKIKPSILCMVDNCYGEFVEMTEPSDVGADMTVGSLIKNPGGGLAPIGGYIAGTNICIDRCAYRLNAPGLGKEVGATLGLNQSFYQGLFFAPTVVSGALKGAIFAANAYEKLGYQVHPNSTEERYDIIQAITFGSPERIISFCRGIQAAAPVDSFCIPEPWAMPGYDADVIMAAGAFVQGSSIELSADAPIKPPYTTYFQGGLTWYHAKIGILKTLQQLIDDHLIALPLPSH